MPKAEELLKQGRTDDLWQMCCGFLSLDLDGFMNIQKRLLMEQIQRLNRSTLGKKIMRGARPETIEEFRQQVPLTTYADYCPELLERKEGILPVKPALWVRTSGKSGEYHCKWVPITPAFSEQLSKVMYGVGILSCCSDWGDMSQVKAIPNIVYTVAPRPYTSGAMASMLELQTSVEYLPSLDEAENLEFEERTRVGFEKALSKGLDYFFGLSLVLVVVGNMFSQSRELKSLLPLIRKPRALMRLVKGLVKSKLAGRPMLPRDVWTVKGIMSGGLDSGVFKDRIKELWGRFPLDTYSGTEGGIIATQTWDYNSMSFVPNLNFLEFIPEAEHFKWQLDHSYQPKTVLLDEVEPGEKYEVVITNFHGGAMVRYRPGDMIAITSLKNERLGINLPQMMFERRADDLIDFGVTRLSERVIWQAMENSGVPYEDWVACKETGESMALHLYVEPKDGVLASEADVAAMIESQLKRLDNSFESNHDGLSGYLDFNIKVTFLPRGAFASYMAYRKAEGAELAHLKPCHINPSERILALLTGAAQPVPVTEAEPEVTAIT